MGTTAWPETYMKVHLWHTPLLSYMCWPSGSQSDIPDPGFDSHEVYGNDNAAAVGWSFL